jgi:hypothetical protein
MLHQWDQRADADPWKIGCCTRRNYRRGKIGRSDPDRALSTIWQLDHHVGGATSRSLPNYRKLFAKQAMPRIRNRDVSYGPIKNCRILRCSVIPPTPMPSSTASSTTRTGSILPVIVCDAHAPASHRRIDRPHHRMQKLISQRGTEPRATSCRNTGRHHLGMPGRLRRNPHRDDAVESRQRLRGLPQSFRRHPKLSFMAG